MDRLCRSRGAGRPLSINVMQKYNDGNFGAANQRLNQLAAQLK
jgi:hypothetical protein